MNDDDGYIHKYHAQFLLSNNNEDLSSGSEYDSAKQKAVCQKNIILGILLNR